MKSNEYLERDYVEWRREENQTQEGDGETSSTWVNWIVFISFIFYSTKTMNKMKRTWKGNQLNSFLFILIVYFHHSHSIINHCFNDHQINHNSNKMNEMKMD